MSCGALPRLIAVLFEVEGFRLNHRENCLRRTEGRNAFEQGYDLESVDSAGLDAEMGGDVACCGHVCGGGSNEKAPLREFRAPIFCDIANPCLFAADINIMAARLKARLDDARPVIEERPYGVTNHLGARK